MLPLCYLKNLVISFVTSTFEGNIFKVIAMKNYWILIVTILMMGMFPQMVLGDSVHVKGKWGDNIIRTIFPKAPEVSIDGNELSVYCADVLSHLSITVTDAEGNVILKECVTIPSGETVRFTLDEAAGTYQIYLDHACGSLQGTFVLY